MCRSYAKVGEKIRTEIAAICRLLFLQFFMAITLYVWRSVKLLFIFNLKFTTVVRVFPCFSFLFLFIRLFILFIHFKMSTDKVLEVLKSNHGSVYCFNQFIYTRSSRVKNKLYFRCRNCKIEDGKYPATGLYSFSITIGLPPYLLL